MRKGKFKCWEWVVSQPDTVLRFINSVVQEILFIDGKTEIGKKQGLHSTVEIKFSEPAPVFFFGVCVLVVVLIVLLGVEPRAQLCLLDLFIHYSCIPPNTAYEPALFAVC